VNFHQKTLEIVSNYLKLPMDCVLGI
jgi:hypothetical protein